MPSSSPNGPSYDSPNNRLFDLFDRALGLPPAERVAFVQRETADDPAMGEELLRLLANADVPSIEVTRRVAPLVTPIHDAPAPPIEGQVRTTATEELLKQLASAPRLDEVRFADEGYIGHGGMGVVRAVHDQLLNRHLALKSILDVHLLTQAHARPGSHPVLTRFLEEAQVTAQLDHPGVVPVQELALDANGDVCFLMRRVQGKTANEVFADAHAGRNGWTVTRALEVLLKVCDTMSYAHDKGVLHRDLKPRNVMVGSFGEVYVMDWGLAKVTDRAGMVESEPANTASWLASPNDRTAPGSTPGTPNYMSPEQAQGELRTLDHRTDVYAIGAMLYELLTGTVPYTSADESADEREVLEKAKAGPPAPIESLQIGVPAELVAIADKAMARDREQRYASVVALAADVRAFLGMQVVSAYKTGALVELKLWVKRNQSLAASLAAAVLILIAGVVTSTTYYREADRQASANAHLAQEKGRTVDNFNQLGVAVRLHDVLARQEELWPAWPDKVDGLRAWLKDCDDLLGMREQIELTVSELRDRAVQRTAEQVEADRRAAPEWLAYERQQQLVAALQRAEAIRVGEAKLELPKLPESLRDADVSLLNAFAWQRVAPESQDGTQQERMTFGEDAQALVAAQAAVKKAAGLPSEAQFSNTLAWALLANGQHTEAVQRSKEALAKATPKEQDALTRSLYSISAVADQWPAQLAAATTQLAELERKVAIRRTWMFGSDVEAESARFLHDALVNVLTGLTSMEQKEKPDVEQRLEWALQVEDASITRYRDRWTEARQAILLANGVTASELYREAQIDLDPQVGLVPIGKNPQTRLWEFYDLRSAWDSEQPATAIHIPTHEPDGSIQMRGETGIIFVLLPGGDIPLGSQNIDQNAPLYDEEHDADERVHMVRLAPFMLARHELTLGQWRRLAGEQPTHWKVGARHHGDQFAIGLTHPADSMDWHTADLWLSRQGMTLPTEAQWEYGARGGTKTAYWPGETAALLQGCANVHDTTSFGPLKHWGEPAPIVDGFCMTSPVGFYRANAFGLHDVHGNVWEWCKDWYGTYGSERFGDGLRQTTYSDRRVFRGGSYNKPAVVARSAYRDHYVPWFRSAYLGFRPARRIAQR